MTGWQGDLETGETGETGWLGDEETWWLDDEVTLVFEGVKLYYGLRIDLLSEKRLNIEIKSVEAWNDIHLVQTLTYLKVGNYKLWLLINGSITF